MMSEIEIFRQLSKQMPNAIDPEHHQTQHKTQTPGDYGNPASI